ncbi:MAG TPA: hypothetical protein VFO18_06080 [Methylomirabilota bacterium]|nr:hypothetical protein [Methylomirabilota bacterium]
MTDPAVKGAIGQCFVDEQQHRARLRMGFPTPNYNGVKTAPGLIVIVADFRFVRAFPVLNDDSDLDRLYKKNAERILLQSVAASTMAAHLAAAALGYAVVDHSHQPGRDPEEGQAAARGAGCPRRHRRHVLRPPAQALLQAVEEAAGSDHELGAVQPRALHDRGADRRVGEDAAPQSHVPRRIQGGLTC